MNIASQNEISTIEEALPAILLRIVSELHDVAYLIERIEPQLLELGGASVLDQPESLKVMQGIDLAVQKTRGIAEFIDTISGGVPAGWMVDVATALSLVKLSEMKKKLSGGAIYTHSAGDFDFF